MRRLAAVLLLLPLVAGCTGPDYHVSGVSATATFGDAWERARAEAGLREAGFEPDAGVASMVVGRVGGTAMRAMPLENGTVELSVEVDVREDAASREAAEERARRAVAEDEARVEGLVAAFERGSGWSRVGPLRWHEGILHGD